MKRECPKCAAQKNKIVKFGRYYRKSDSKWVSRYRCKRCGKNFSSATFSNCFGQKKRRLNSLIYKELSSKTSQRRLAILLNTTRKTVARKQKFLADKCRRENAEWLKKRTAAQFVQVDDLETIEHTKLKPVTITVVVEEKTRKILGYSVAQIPAKGLIAKKSRKKYGFRADHSRRERRKLFESLRPVISERAEFRSDQHQDYPLVIKKYFPRATHETFKRVKGAVTGQGELKKTQYDPIFWVNHTLAMLRYSIIRLARKTWCTTKKIEALEDHLAIYMHYHNHVLTSN